MAPPLGYRPYLNAYLTQVWDLLRYLGLALVLAVGLYFRNLRFERKEIFLLLPVASFLVLFPYHPTSLDIRYFLPLMPFLCVWISKHLVVKGKIGSVLLTLVCLAQFLAVTGYVHGKRRVPSEIHEAFQYLRGQTPADSFIMYPEYLLNEATERKVVWGGLRNLAELLWTEDSQRLSALFYESAVDYIMVRNDRIYEDSEVRHFGGFPVSFVRRMPDMRFLNKVFENTKTTIWRVNRLKAGEKL
jgi:hypothetical protein